MLIPLGYRPIKPSQNGKETIDTRFTGSAIVYFVLKTSRDNQTLQSWETVVLSAATPTLWL